MGNPLISGVIILVISALGYFLSWWYLRKNRYAPAIAFLMISGLILRIYTSSDGYIHEWDERYHALVAKNLIQQPFKPMLLENPVLPYDYRNWTANHIWVHKQPLPLWIMSVSMWAFGINELSLRLPSILLSTLGIWLVFMIGSFFFHRKTGYLAALFFSINGLIIELAAGRVATDHIDIFFMVFILLAITFSILYVQRGKTLFTVLAGISIGAAILSKWLPAFIVLPVWLLLMIDSGKFSQKTIICQFTLLIAISTMVFLPWQLYIFNAFPMEAKWEAGFNLKHFTEVLEGRTGPFYYFIDKIRVNYGELIYLPLGWFTWKALRPPYDLKRAAIAIWVWIPIIFFSFAKTKMQGYILFTAPALFIMTAEFYGFIVEYAHTRKRRWAYSILLFLFIALPARYMIERVKPFGTDDRHPQWTHDLRDLNRRNIKNGVLFNYNKPVEAMFYTDLVAYSLTPDPSVIIGLQGKGYTVILNDNGNLPSTIRSLKGVTLIKLTENR